MGRPHTFRYEDHGPPPRSRAEPLHRGASVEPADLRHPVHVEPFQFLHRHDAESIDRRVDLARLAIHRALVSCIEERLRPTLAGL